LHDELNQFRLFQVCRKLDVAVEVKFFKGYLFTICLECVRPLCGHWSWFWNTHACFASL